MYYCIPIPPPHPAMLCINLSQLLRLGQLIPETIAKFYRKKNAVWEIWCKHLAGPDEIQNTILKGFCSVHEEGFGESSNIFS